MIEQLPVLIVALPLGAALLCPILRFASLPLVRVAVASTLSAAVLLSGAALAAVLSGEPLEYAFGGWPAPLGIAYRVDPLGALMALLVSLFAWLGCFGLSEETRGWSASRAAAFYALYLLLAAGLLGIALTGDLFNLYVFLEIASLAAYALTAAGGDRARVAAYRYLILGSVGASFWVLGLGYLYALTGTLNMADMALRLGAGAPAAWDSPAAATGLAFIAAGLAVKMALFPLHGWQPDAYAYAPGGLMALMAGIMPKVSAYTLFRVLYWVFSGRGPAGAVSEVLVPLAILSMIAGGALALSQRDLRRMLAYSSVSQIGTVMLGFAAAMPAAALLHLVGHAFMKATLFLAAEGYRRRAGASDIPDLAGLGKRMPWNSAAFAVAALSMVGLPPFAGFFSKLYLLRGAVALQAWPMAAALIASSLLSALAFFRVLERLYLHPDGDREWKRGDAPPATLLPALALAAGVLVLGLANEPLVTGVLDRAVPPRSSAAERAE